MMTHSRGCVAVRDASCHWPPLVDRWKLWLCVVQVQAEKRDSMPSVSYVYTAEAIKHIHLFDLLNKTMLLLRIIKQEFTGYAFG